MSTPEGRGDAWTLFFAADPPQERGTSDEGPPPQAAKRAWRRLEALRRQK